MATRHPQRRAFGAGGIGNGGDRPPGNNRRNAPIRGHYLSDWSTAGVFKGHIHCLHCGKSAGPAHRENWKNCQGECPLHAGQMNQHGSYGAHQQDQQDFRALQNQGFGNNTYGSYGAEQSLTPNQLTYPGFGQQGSYGATYNHSSYGAGFDGRRQDRWSNAPPQRPQTSSSFGAGSGWHQSQPLLSRGGFRGRRDPRDHSPRRDAEYQQYRDRSMPRPRGPYIDSGFGGGRPRTPSVTGHLAQERPAHSSVPLMTQEQGSQFVAEQMLRLRIEVQRLNQVLGQQPRQDTQQAPRESRAHVNGQQIEIKKEDEEQ